MKAKFLILSLVLALGSIAANAQERDDNAIAPKVSFEQNPGAHWFIDLYGGATMLPFGKINSEANFMDRVSPAASIAVGRWHTPYFATRVRAYGWNVYGFAKPDGVKSERYSNYFAAGSFEFMFDLINALTPYRETRVFHIIPFLGLGAHYRIMTQDAKGQEAGRKGNEWSGLVNGGLALKFRLGKRVDLNLEGQMMMSKNNFVGSSVGLNEPDLTAAAFAGLSFKLGQVEFVPITPMDYELVNNLNSQISTLRAENAELSKRPVSCPECPEVAPVTEIKQKIENVVYFRIGSAKIDKNQLINIYNTAQYAKANNSKVYVVGYADEKTGTAKINMSLSQRRAEAVKAELVNTYGINADDIVIDYKGDTVQPFEVNEWNRIAIMTIE